MPRMRCKLSAVAGAGRRGRAGPVGSAAGAEGLVAAGAGEGAGLANDAPDRAGKAAAGLADAASDGLSTGPRAKAARSDTRGGAGTLPARSAEDAAPGGALRRRGGAIVVGGMLGAARRGAAWGAGAARLDPRSGWRSRSRRGLGAGRSASRRRWPASGPARSNFRD